LFVRRSRYTRISKAYKLVPDKLGRYNRYDINKPIFKNLLHRGLGIRTRAGVSVSEVVRIKFVWITNHLRGVLGIQIRIRAIKVRIPRCLGIQTGVGVSVSELVRIKFVRITNHLRGVSVSKQFGYRDPSVFVQTLRFGQLSLSKRCMGKLNVAIQFNVG